MKSWVPEEEQPLAACEGWIWGNAGFCWAPAEAWEMRQAEICALCELHNRAKHIDLPVERVERPQLFVAEGAKRCQHCGEKTLKRRLLCALCLAEKTRRQRYKKRQIA